MMKRAHHIGVSLPVAGDMLCSLLTLPTGLQWVYEGYDMERGVLRTEYLVAALLLMGLARLFRAYRLRERSRLDFYRFLIYGALILFALVFWIFRPSHRIGNLVVFLSYWSTLVSDRVISIARNRSLRNVILNIIAIVALVLLIGFIFVHYADADPYDIMLDMTVFIGSYHALATIASVVFARLNVDVLRKIIRRTYALEILLGLLLLMMSFAYILRFTEPSTPTFKDALWYCFAIVTTIGFGDVAATSLEGRIISVILGAYGIVVVALDTSIIVNFYGEMKKKDAREEE